MLQTTLLCRAYKKSFVKENSEEITLYRKIHEKKPERFLLLSFY